MSVPSNPFNLNVLLRRLLPVICIGVVGNLAFSWYTSGRENRHDWSAFSAAYLALAGVLSLLPWFWHCLRLAIWGRFFGVNISGRNLLRIAVATDVGGAIAPQAVGGAPLKITMLVQQGYSPGKATALTLLSGVEDAIFFALAIPVSLLLTRPWENQLWQKAGHFLEDNCFLLLPVLAVLAAAWFLLKKIRPRYFRQPAAPRWRSWASDIKSTVQLITSRPISGRG